jgi:tRNA (guanine37-N1)-methyltransferase
MRLRERLRGIIPEDDLARLSNRFHVVGDIAIISVHPKMEIYKMDIAKTIVSGHRNIKTVLNKVSKLEGDRRVAGFEILAGNETVTAHREFGFCYRLDLRKVFFNSHLGYERRRVALKVIPGERVLVPFCGVGPYVVPVAATGARVVAIESNSEACKWMTENARLNGVEDNIDFIKGDALDVADLLNLRHLKFDRAIIPTPYGMDRVLDIFSPLVKKGGTIHFYTFKKKHQIDGLIAKYENARLEVEFYRSCGNVAPGVCRWVFDLVKG